MASLQSFVPATCPTKFSQLNSVRHVAWTKYPPNWCCSIIKVSVHTRGHVAATCPWNMYPQHFHVCTNVVILSLLHVPATRPCYMSPQCVPHKCYVPATCRCDMSLEHVPATFSCVYKCCDFVPATCPRYMSLLHVALVCTTQVLRPCNMSLRHVAGT